MEDCCLAVKLVEGVGEEGGRGGGGERVEEGTGIVEGFAGFREES